MPINYHNKAMRDWRNRQTRAFKGRMGDRVSSSLTSRTNKTANQLQQKGSVQNASFSFCFVAACTLVRSLHNG